ncbi:GNAT family N-acetyltransferase [Dongia deserti]|uniref:GNAT family N-acetyltransferase n=1 Tax=Dongia deserti TaxID=2268030 RepID=UPI000E646AE4|nr:GNAT family N-acetyltransferase [Dongia deserti]
MPHFAIVSRHPLSQPAAVVRLAGFHEMATITDLLFRANHEYRKVLPLRVYDAHMRDLGALTASWADKDFLIAESDGRMLGAVAFYRDASRQNWNLGWTLPSEWASLRALAVNPEVRGRGIGRQLAEACMLRAWRIGRQVLSVHNAEFQSVARKLYLQMGFRRCPQYDLNVGDLPDHDPNGERLAIEAFCLGLKR